MVNYGVVVAVVAEMAICRTNEVVQHEGCNVLGTMAKTLAENGFEFDHVRKSTSVVDAAVNKVVGRCGIVNSQNVYKENKKVGVQHDEMKGSATVDDWWAALWEVFVRVEFLGQNGNNLVTGLGSSTQAYTFLLTA